jgi:hypothetical protein
MSRNMMLAAWYAAWFQPRVFNVTVEYVSSSCCNKACHERRIFHEGTIVNRVHVPEAYGGVVALEAGLHV